MTREATHGNLERDYRVFRDRGDASALARVFDSAAPELLRVASYLTTDPHVAEDATMLVYYRAGKVAKKQALTLVPGRLNEIKP